MKDAADELEDVVRELDALGLRQMDGSPLLMETLEDPQATEKDRLDAYCEMQSQLVDASNAVLSGEMEKMERWLSDHDPKAGAYNLVQAMHQAFDQQRRGLVLLRTFFQDGDHAHLEAAKGLLEEGARRARALVPPGH